MTTRKISLAEAFSYFAFFTLMLFISTRYVIPVFNGWGIHPAISWFISGGIFVFAPIYFLALRNVRKELNTSNRSDILNRLWLKKMTSKDWLVALGGTLLIVVLTGMIIFVADWAWQNFLGKPLETSPAFMRFEPFQPAQYWIYMVWIIFFYFNIVGEEVMWRGYLLAGMSVQYPKTAWLFNAIFWMMFHIPFGIELMIMVLPTFFLIPYIVQKRKNIWIGIIIHAGLNGPGFILVTLGILKQ
jgi:membrane protease YdiL (CAAX protease family)